MHKKENFCFHCSRLRAENKNVPRLITAAKKFGFQLKLAGALHGKEDEKWLKDLIGNSSNIEYVGMISDEELISYYKRCKVFALPSLVEGVGMVALEAATQGAEIVLTNDGAPKDYYQGRAYLVNPRSVDEIGQACLLALKGGKQPELLDFMHKHDGLDIPF
jgi:glycosyltransferase involved in cell wall biosynthesis